MEEISDRTDLSIYIYITRCIWVFFLGLERNCIWCENVSLLPAVAEKNEASTVSVETIQHQSDPLSTDKHLGESEGRVSDIFMWETEGERGNGNGRAKTAVIGITLAIEKLAFCSRSLTRLSL